MRNLLTHELLMLEINQIKFHVAKIFLNLQIAASEFSSLISLVKFTCFIFLVCEVKRASPVAQTNDTTRK